MVKKLNYKIYSYPNQNLVLDSINDLMILIILIFLNLIWVHWMDQPILLILIQTVQLM